MSPRSASRKIARLQALSRRLLPIELTQLGSYPEKMVLQPIPNENFSPLAFFLAAKRPSQRALSGYPSSIAHILFFARR